MEAVLAIAGRICRSGLLLVKLVFGSESAFDSGSARGLDNGTG